MKVIIMVAYGTNNVIGNSGTLPAWKLPADMAHFKNNTVGNAVVMGRKTYESFGKYTPLPDRDNIIVTRNPEYRPVNANGKTYVCHSLNRAISIAEDKGHEKVFIIGGGEIYKEALIQNDFPIDEIIATEIEGSFEGDTVFPIIERIWWDQHELKKVEKDEKNSHSFRIMQYIQK